MPAAMDLAGRQAPLDRNQGIDSGIAGDVDRAAYPLARQIGGGELGRCEQQRRFGVDRAAIFFFGPGKRFVVGPEARFDMRHRNSGGEAAQRRSERARRVSLDHQQVGAGNEQVADCSSDLVDMDVRVLLAG
jgi:hypothetical protein